MATTQTNGDLNTILVVEDGPTQAEALKYMLEKHRYRVATAANGRKALAMMELERKPRPLKKDIV